MHSVRAQNHRNAAVVADLKLQLLTLDYNIYYFILSDYSVVFFFFFNSPSL